MSLPRRALLISYYFPPSGGPGVQRTLKFAKYLPDFGWQPTVLTVHPDYAAFPDYDPTLEGEIPEAVRVVRTRAWDPYALYAGLQGKPKDQAVGVGFIKEEAGGWQARLARWLRANVFLPDARVGWVPFAWQAARRLLRDERFSVMMTSGPPHSAHLVGWALRRAGVPWVADFRDPWTDISYYETLPHTALARKLDAALERHVLSAADAVVSVSDGFGALLRAKATIDRYETIYNGFDAEDMPAAAPEGSSDQFVVAHVGTLTASQHAPGFVDALARLAADANFRRRLRVRFVGHVDATIVEALAAAGLGDVVEQIPYVPHAEAIEHMRRANLLMVAVQNVDKNAGVIPAKAFEHLALGIPILGLAPPTGDLASILRETGGGAVFHHEDTAGIAAFVERHARHADVVAPPEARALHGFDRRALTGRLARLFDELSAR